MTDASPQSTAQQYWEGFYRQRDEDSLGDRAGDGDRDRDRDRGRGEDRDRDRAGDRAGRPNELLVREAGSLTPGTALDLGCAEGADAIWLAERGWRVTAVDVSGTALRRAADRAAAAGLAERIDWQRHDLSQSFPAGVFDLVSAQFLHSPVEAPNERERILRRAAAAVAPGGVLLITGHTGWPSWLRIPPFDYHFPTTREVLDSLALAPGQWRVELEDLVSRALTAPDGSPGTRLDNVLRVRRVAH